MSRRATGAGGGAVRAMGGGDKGGAGAATGGLAEAAWDSGAGSAWESAGGAVRGTGDEGEADLDGGAVVLAMGALD